MIGQTLGHYRVLEQIGAGGMGVVYRAHDERLDRDVALKVLPADVFQGEAARARLLREARTASKLNHPHICTVHEVGEADGQTYIAMELVEGQPLSVKLLSGPLPATEVVRLGLQLAEGLAHAHERGVVHRDLKSANVVITPEGRAKVLDFGLAKRMSEDAAGVEATQSQISLTQPGSVVGTLAYMSPEQLRGQPADTRSDVWALGAVLYEMAAGKLPFQGQTGFELSSAIMSQPPAPLPGKAPVELKAVIERCLEKNPQGRYQRGGELRAALEAVQTGTVRRWEPWRYRLRKRRWPPLALASLALVAVLAGLILERTRTPSGSGTPQIESVAVLPLVNASADPDVEYLADGITESLINSLSQVPHLAVMSRNAVFRYKGRDTDAQAAGQTLKVQAVLTGRVVQRGDSLSISAELIEVRNNRHLWGEQYNRTVRDILAVQEDISTEISEKLRFRLTGEQKKRLTKRYTQNTQAYELYLRGRYHWNKKNPEGFNKGIEYFQKAIEADPNYAPAYAGLAALYNNLANYNFALVPPREAWAKAKAAAGKAVQIDDSLAPAHASLALVAYQWEWDWSTAEKEFQRALELDPSSSSTYEPSPSSTYHWYSHYLMTMGRTEESFRAGRRALELDPLDLANNGHQGWHYLWTRQYDRAIEPLQKTIEMDPNFPPAQWYLGLAYEQKGAFQDAIAQFQNCVRITGGRPSMLALLGHAHAAANRRSEAQAILQQLSALSKQRYVPSYPIAAIYAALGQKDEAFAWLERAYDERDSWMDYLGTDPRLDGLRSDPRFRDLLRRMNLPP
ncbi:MAG: protein kinase [Acidobacteria bacterium]|nr:protein kinase [Acidobacteriota bacterium]